MRRFVLTMVWIGLTAGAGAEDAPKRPPAKEPEIRDELIRRAKADQDARKAVTEWMMLIGNPEVTDQAAFQASLTATQKAEFKTLADTLNRVDAENTEALGKIVERHGWPTVTLVGKGGANAAWLIVQHADLSLKFQRKCLDLMGKVPRDEVSQTDVAFLTDRVLLAEGKKQVYGTQFTYSNGKWEPRPLEDAASVDKRRAEVGLEPLVEYIKAMEALYGLPSKK